MLRWLPSCDLSSSKSHSAHMACQICSLSLLCGYVMDSLAGFPSPLRKQITLFHLEPTPRLPSWPTSKSKWLMGGAESASVFYQTQKLDYSHMHPPISVPENHCWVHASLPSFFTSSARDSCLDSLPSSPCHCQFGRLYLASSSWSMTPAHGTNLF